MSETSEVLDDWAKVSARGSGQCAPNAPLLRRSAHVRTMAVIALSLALHGLILGPLALNVFGSTPRLAFPQHRDTLYLDITPRPIGTRGTTSGFSKSAAPPGTSPSSTSTRLQSSLPTPTPRSATETVPPATPPQAITDPWRVRPDDPAARIGNALRRGAAGCQMLNDQLAPIEQAQCDRRFAERAADAAPITGSGDPDRDARFAAAGAQALADYERRRAPLKPNSRAQPCPHGNDLMGECPVRVIVPIYSKRFIIDPEMA